MGHFGSYAHITQMCHSNVIMGDKDVLFSDIFKEGDINRSSVRQPEFYASIYSRAITCTGRLYPLHTDIEAVFQSCEWPAGLPFESAIAKELVEFSHTKNWLFEKTLSEDLISYVVFACFPKFLWHVYDLMRYHDSKYETNYFSYLYNKAVISKMCTCPTLGTGLDAIQHTQSRWWLLYVVKTFGDEMLSFATDYLAKLGVETPSAQVSRSVAIDSAKEIFYSMKLRCKKYLLTCLESGSGIRAYEYVRPLLDEKCMTRHATSEPLRIEFSIDSSADVGSQFTITTKDKSKWYEHTKRIADSHLYQAYTINDSGVLEPILPSNELSDFVARNMAFETGESITNKYSMSDFEEKAYDGRFFIDINRVSGYINENGFNIPHVIDGANIIYTNSTKDLFFSTNPRDGINGSISALELDQKIKLQHLYNGSVVKLGEKEYEFSSAVTAELALIMMQRVYALILPETSLTGSMVTTYDNVHGTVLIDGTSIPAGSWINKMLVGGGNTTLYNSITPMLSFLSRLHIDGIPLSNDKEVLIGGSLAAQFLAMLKAYGFEDLKTQMVASVWNGSAPSLDIKDKLFSGWTSSYGQTNSLTMLRGYGNKLMQAQCIKHLFSTISSSTLLEVFARSVSYFLAHNTTANPDLSVTLLKEFSKSPVTP